VTIYALARTARLDLESFARACGMHPHQVLRFVRLGLLDAEQDSSGGLWFERSQIAQVARIQRLRAGFSLNYAALGLVLDLLDRVSMLEAAARRRPRRTGVSTWT
jgi:chaperone modulatory protein CbpM